MRPLHRSLRTRFACRARSFLVCACLALVALGCGGGEESAAERAQADAVCQAVRAGRFAEALAESGAGASATGAGRQIAECRCIAQLQTGAGEHCTAALTPLLKRPEAADWVPHPAIAQRMIEAYRAAGDIDSALVLAKRVAPPHRQHLSILQQELQLRSAFEDPAVVFEELAARIDDDPSWIPQRIVLATAWNQRGRFDEALSILGEVAPPIASRAALPWYETRIAALAKSGDLAAVQATFADWRATGWDADDLAARYALRLSVDHLTDPERSTLDLLREAIASSGSLRDTKLAWALHRRLITETLAAGRPEEALAAYDVAIQTVPLEDVSRAELERAVARARPEGRSDEKAHLVLRAPAGFEGGTWRIAPDATSPPDSGYRSMPASAAGEVRLDLPVGLHPQRWVLDDTQGRPVASGSVWPERGATTRVEAALGPETKATLPLAQTKRRPADGRRRVFAILADCADWRLTEYLRARDELPFQDRLFEEGHRAVLESRPAFTAAAMQALVWPGERETQPSTLGQIHRLGLELAGLESIGRNPVDFLSWFLPERASLFDTLGAGPVATANMLLAHGQIEAGRHAEIVGPHGHRAELETTGAVRGLTAEELARHPALHSDPDTRRHAETIASEMDAAEAIAREGEIDFLFLRLEALDLVTHGHYGALDGTGQDDGQGPLLSTYRYIDERLAALHALLDEDDWLVYMSDHGIRSSMQHEEDAIFVVHGAGVPPGRAPGRPALGGLPHSFAAMFGVATDWPASGTAEWLADTVRAEDPAKSPEGAVAATLP